MQSNPHKTLIHMYTVSEKKIYAFYILNLQYIKLSLNPESVDDVETNIFEKIKLPQILEQQLQTQGSFYNVHQEGLYSYQILLCKLNTSLSKAPFSQIYQQFSDGQS